MDNTENGEDLKIAGERELNVLAKIKHHIRESELNQETVAKRVGVSPSSFSQILGGLRPLKLSVILGLIKELSLDPRIFAPPGFYSKKKITKLQNEEIFERIFNKLQKLDAVDDRFLGIVESHLDGILSANKVHRTIQREKRRKK